MIKTITFIEKENNFQFTVKEEFLQKCPNPSELNAGELMLTNEIYKYFHNENGPAIVHLTDPKGEDSYWLDGKPLSKEDYNTQINNGENK